MEIIQLQKMVKSVSLRLETQADMTLHVYKCSSQHDRKDCSKYRNGTNRAGRHWVRVAQGLLWVNHPVVYCTAVKLMCLDEMKYKDLKLKLRQSMEKKYAKNCVYTFSYSRLSIIHLGD
jgi:hypothetical protein